MSMVVFVLFTPSIRADVELPAVMIQTQGLENEKNFI